MTVKDGHPSLHVPNILACDYDTNPHSVVQDDPQYYAYTEFIGINDIFNTYDLTKEQKEHLFVEINSVRSSGLPTEHSKIISHYFLKFLWHKIVLLSFLL